MFHVSKLLKICELWIMSLLHEFLYEFCVIGMHTCSLYVGSALDNEFKELNSR